MGLTVSIPVKGMHCGGCASRLSTYLNGLPGTRADVNFALEAARVELPEGQAIGALLESLKTQGFTTETSRLSATVTGMTCAGCASKIQKALRSHPLVLNAEVNFATGQLVVKAVAGTLALQDLRAVVEPLGYKVQARSAAARVRKAELAEQERMVQSDYRRQRNQVALAWLLTLPLLMGMAAMFMGQPRWHLSPWLEWLLATPVQFYIGARFYRGAWRSLRHGSANMDVLVAAGTSAAYFFSLYLWSNLGSQAHGQLYFEASAVVITLVTMGKWLEARARRSATRAIRELMALRPDSAWVMRNGVWQQVDVDEVEEGEQLRILAGEKVPVDGSILDGRSELDEALITGESLPVNKQAGDSVIAGSINGSGRLLIKATAVGEDTSLARIINLVERAQMGKAPIQQLVDRISAIFVPVVMLIAAASFITWWSLGGDFGQALIASVAVLVIACPCALGLATPAALVTGTGIAARHGILIRDVDTLQKAHRVQAVVFDKTGTLTVGEPRVVKLVGDEPALKLAASLQQDSDHPLARAVVAAVAGQPLDASSEVQTVPGYGIEGQVAGHKVAVGSEQLVSKLGLSLPTWRLGGEFDRASRVWVAVDGEVKAVLALADEVRPESSLAINRLHAQGIRTIMISGDGEGPVKNIAAELGLDEAYATVKPGEKAAMVASLRDQGWQHIAMVGDGINDAPALAEADVGIAMGSGTDVAMETASITLMRSDPNLVVDAIAISAATWRKIQENLFWAFIFNVIGIPLAALGLLSPVVAGAAMALSSVTVLGNSLLLSRWRPGAGV